LRLSLATVFERGREGLAPELPDPTGELLDFIAERLKVHLREQAIRHDVVAAAFGKAGDEDDLVRLLARVDALRAFLASEDGTNLLVAYRRAGSIVSIEERRDGRRYDGEVNRALLRQPEERALVDRLDKVGSRAGTLLAVEGFERAMTELARLRGPIDDFFDTVTVNCDEAALRENRLRLLSRVQATLNQLADFSQIEG
jgi:glycyl-tRNA synthetase beta chain